MHFLCILRPIKCHFMSFRSFCFKGIEGIDETDLDGFHSIPSFEFFDGPIETNGHAP